MQSTPVAALEREADLPPFSIRRRQLAAAAVQGHLRGPPDDPLLPLLTEPRPRLRLRHDRGWVETGMSFSAEAGLANLSIEPILVVPEAAPWEDVPSRVSIRTTLCRPTKKSDPPEVRLAAAQDTLDRLPPADIG